MVVGEGRERAEATPLPSHGPCQEPLMCHDMGGRRAGGEKEGEEEGEGEG